MKVSIAQYMILPMKRFPPLRVWTDCVVWTAFMHSARRPLPSRPPSLSTQVTAQKIVRILGILSDWMPAFVAASRRHSREKREERRDRQQGVEHGSRQREEEEGREAVTPR